MFRKITHISIALILLITSTGFALSKHFCNNQLVEVVIDKQAETCCDDENCCRTETVLVKLDDEVVSKAIVSVPSDQFNIIMVQVAINLLVSYIAEPEKEEFVEFISPPPPKMQSKLSALQTYLL